MVNSIFSIHSVSVGSLLYSLHWIQICYKLIYNKKLRYKLCKYVVVRSCLYMYVYVGTYFISPIYLLFLSLFLHFFFFLLFFLFFNKLYYPRNNNKYGGVRDGALISPPYTCTAIHTVINNTSSQL